MEGCATFHIAHFEQLRMVRQDSLLHLEVIRVYRSKQRDEELVTFFLACH